MNTAALDNNISKETRRLNGALHVPFSLHFLVFLGAYVSAVTVNQTEVASTATQTFNKTNKRGNISFLWQVESDENDMCVLNPTNICSDSQSPINIRS